MDLLVEDFKLNCKVAWIKFAIKKKFSKNNISEREGIFKNLNDFIIENFKFMSIKDKWIEFQRKSAEQFLKDAISNDTHGNNLWDNKKALELSSLFINEFSEYPRFFGNTYIEYQFAKIERADTRKPVWELGLLALDVKKIGGIWISIHEDPHAIRIYNYH